MTRMKASDFDREVLDLFDGYVHGDISRREFLDRAKVYAVGGVTAAALLESLSPKYAEAQQVAPDDERLETGYVEYDSPQGYGKVKGLLARPAGNGKLPGVVVIHENRGLNPYIEDVCRRTALAGYLALAPDGLTSLGGYPGTDDEGRAMQRKLDSEKILEDFVAGVKYLQSHPDCTGRVGCVGFCFGGWVANMLAVRVPDLAAAAPFYGRQPSAEDVAKIKAPLLLQYAGNDERVNAGWPAYEEALKANGVDYTAYVYPDVNHGFHNDTTPRYDEEAAKLAWQRTLAFFAEHLR
ncbi:MAG: YghX family hydrolase [Acidobacteriota bacterium]|jgi:carboxymethylenebutenolidase|nr:dienelactone hydrolase family protein [Acidobacteriota bacterium]